MKNKIYPFLLGLSCIVIVALVSFKNSEKVVEKEQMTIVAHGSHGGSYILHISTGNSYEALTIARPKGDVFNYSELLNKVQEYQKLGWVVTNSNHIAGGTGIYELFYSLEREKK